MSGEPTQPGLIRVYATSKLRNRLPLDDHGALQSVQRGARQLNPNPLSGWHADLKILQRRQCVIFVHDQTRFALVLPCLRKPDFENLDRHFADVFVNTLLKVGMPPEAINQAAAYIAPLRFDHALDRSVMGTLNQLAADLEHKLWYERQAITDLLPYSTSAWLSDRPCHVKGQKDCIWPIDAMRELVSRTIH